MTFFVKYKQIYNSDNDNIQTIINIWIKIFF